MTAILKVIRNGKGEYIINSESYVSVTTVQNSVCGMFESLVNNYHCKLCRVYNKNIFDCHDHKIGYIKYENLKLGIVHAKNDRTQKGEYGKRAHGILESVFFLHTPVPTDFACRVSAITKIYNELSLNLISPPEMTLYHSRLKSAGTTDVVAISQKFSNTRLYIIDYKTGSPNKHKEAIQIGAYGNFIEYMLKNHILYIPGLSKKFTIHGLTLHIGRSDEEKVKPTFLSPNTMKLGALAFKNLLKVYRYNKTKLI